MVWSSPCRAARREGMQHLIVSLFLTEWAELLAEGNKIVFDALPNIDELMEHEESSAGPRMPSKQPSTTCMSLLKLMQSTLPAAHTLIHNIVSLLFFAQMQCKQSQGCSVSNLTLGSPVSYLAVHQIDAERCSLFCVFPI